MPIFDFNHTDLGYPQRGSYSFRQTSRTSVTDIEKGSPVARVEDENRIKTARLNWQFTTRQMQEFENMWESSLRYGALPVRMQLFMENGYVDKLVYITSYSYTILSSDSFNLRTNITIDNGSLGQ